MGIGLRANGQTTRNMVKALSTIRIVPLALVLMRGTIKFVVVRNTK